MIQPGDRIRDNDPRMPNRVLRVVSVHERSVIASLRGGSDATGQTRISPKRIFTDGKPRRYGWNRVSEPQTTGETP